MSYALVSHAAPACRWLCICWLVGVQSLAAQWSFSEQKAKLMAHPARDSQRVDLMQFLAGMYSIRRYDSMYYWAEASRHLADSLAYGPGLAQAWRLMAASQIQQSEFIQAEAYGLRALRVADSIGHTTQKGRALMTLGELEFFRDAYEPAAAYILQALPLFEALADTQRVIFAQRWLGVIYAVAEVWDQSLAYHQAALEGFAQSQNALGVAGQQNNLLMVYAQQGQALLPADSTAARVAFRQAIQHGEAAIRSFEAFGDRMGQGMAHMNLGAVYLDLEEGEKALRAFDQALNLLAQTQKANSLHEIYLGKAQAYLLLSQPAKALPWAHRALAGDLSQPSPSQQEAVLQVLAQLEEAQGNYETAYQLYQEAECFRQAGRDNPLQRAQTRRLLGEHEARMQALQLAQVDQQARRSRLRLWGLTAVGGLGLTGGLIWLLQLWRLRQRSQALARQQARQQRAALALAQAQLAQANLQQQEIQQTLALKRQLLREEAQRIGQRQAWITQLKEAQAPPQLRSLLRQGMVAAQGWEDMQRLFEEVHPRFLPALKRQFPALTKGDLRLASLYRLRLSREEIADFLAITPASLKTARSRLRKKLGLPPEQSLSAFLVEWDPQFDLSPADA